MEFSAGAREEEVAEPRKVTNLLFTTADVTNTLTDPEVSGWLPMHSKENLEVNCNGDRYVRRGEIKS